MASDDRCCSIVPYFKVHDEKMDAFREISERCVAQTSEEEGMSVLRFLLRWR